MAASSRPASLPVVLVVLHHRLSELASSAAGNGPASGSVSEVLGRHAAGGERRAQSDWVIDRQVNRAFPWHAIAVSLPKNIVTLDTRPS